MRVIHFTESNGNSIHSLLFVEATSDKSRPQSSGTFSVSVAAAAVPAAVPAAAAKHRLSASRTVRHLHTDAVEASCL